MAKTKESVNIIQLGGKGVIGNNLILIEYKKEILVLDAGIMFPTDEMPGIDLVIPDMTYLKENRNRVKALLLSHGHEDHIGAVPYLISEVKMPIYGTKLTIEFVKNKLKDRNLLNRTNLNVVKPRSQITVGNFEAEFINVNHSIPGATAIAIKTSVGKVLYTGDFKIDQNPINEEPTDFYKLAKLGEEGLLALLSDSTNAEKNGYTASESTIGKVLRDKFIEAEGRIIVATFSSHIHRIQQIITAAKITNRKIAVSGRSMVNSIEIAQNLNYIDLPKDMLIDLRKIDKLDPEQIIILMTGSQGEPRAALTKVARGEHRYININSKDTIFISATPIPGNELAVSNTVNQLLEKGAEVIYGNKLDVHASGHARQEELKLMLNVTKPDYFIPVHGEYKHLHHHAQMANNLGISKENIFLIPNGIQLELNPNEAKVTDKVPAGKVLIDGLEAGKAESELLNNRQALAQNGILIILLTIKQKNSEMIAGPNIVSKGFVHKKNTKKLNKEIKSKLNEIFAQNITDQTKLKKQIKKTLKNFLYQKLERTPMILPLITKV